MRTQTVLSRLPLGVLAACLASALALPTPASATTFHVDQCADTGAGSLRAVIGDPAMVDGDVVDLDHVPLTCSTITLDQGEIVVAHNISVIDSASRPAMLKISGNQASRVFNHSIPGTFTIDRVELTDGLFSASTANAYGGCIYSAGSVTLDHAVVSHCTTDYSGASTTFRSNGGGVFARGTVELIFSRVSDNTASSDASLSSGGGVFAQTYLNAKYSSIAGNTARYGAGAATGLSSQGALIVASTIETNHAVDGGWGLQVSGDSSMSSVTIINSSVSGNTSNTQQLSALSGAITVARVPSILIANSTIAFNQSDGNLSGAGLAIWGVSVPAALTLRNAIVAENTNGNGSADLYFKQDPTGTSTLDGSNNLVMASDIPPGMSLPSDTLSDPPLLGQLAYNGGPTRTNALLAGSPAIDAGDTSTSGFDQRGPCYPRTVGNDVPAKVDIGAYEFDDDKVSCNGFD